MATGKANLGEMSRDVIALPGGVMPAELRYAPLKSALASEAEIYTKDLEVYATDAPPTDYGVDLEVEALGDFADSLGLQRFHLVGYSGGGFVSLAFAGTHPDRLLTLAVFEPAWVPGERDAEEIEWWAQLDRGLAGKTGPDFMAAFMRLQTRPDVELPPPSGPPPPWMGNRPAGLTAMIGAFGRYRFDRASLSRVKVPVLFGYGDQTGEQEGIKASRLSRLLPDLHIRQFAGMHHFMPPERIYTTEHVAAIRELWARDTPSQ